ncbi:hypothetical protein DLAC_03541 [Tieghemostelium lacteum]|uniref:IPT/TIG domain-containing protein n=1 Tax=Tieghemostelium lacteum TaxID=361077 RepID=A0A152A1A1_TIELA|nr:hypothetical protein DLAC_03541 [Tieghemostelium lacteum]|eukprot:KYR00043.1 hypothetical protein DLAC_03541 [Tieghemostelium lacteum]
MAIQVLLKETMSGLSDLEIKYLQDVHQQSADLQLCTHYENRFYYRICQANTISSITVLLEMMTSLPSATIYSFGDLVVYYIPTPGSYREQRQQEILLPNSNITAASSIDFDGFAVVKMNGFLCDISLIYQQQMDVQQLSTINLCNLGAGIITSIFPTEGPTNATQMLISGLYFTPNETVEVGGEPCIVLSQNSNQIQCQLTGTGGRNNLVSLVNNPLLQQGTRFYFSFLPPTIDSVELNILNISSPSSTWPWNSEVIIHGDNFGNSIDRLTITLNDIPVENIVELSHETIRFTLAGYYYGIVNIQVIVNGQYTSFEYRQLSKSIIDLTELPLITNVDQAESLDGGKNQQFSIVMSGKYLPNSFLNDDDEPMVFVGDQQCAVEYSDSDQLWFRVSPQVPRLSNQTIRVNVGNHQIIASQLTTFPKPSGRVVETNRLIPTDGGYIQIYGSGWGYFSSELDLQLSTFVNTPLQCDSFDVRLLCYVPPGIGKTLHIYRQSDHSVYISNSVSYYAPVIESLEALPTGTLVIHGKNFVPNNQLLYSNETTFVGVTTLSQPTEVIQVQATFIDSTRIDLVQLSITIDLIDITTITVSIASQVTQFSTTKKLYGYVSTIDMQRLYDVTVTLFNLEISYTVRTDSNGFYSMQWFLPAAIYQVYIGELNPLIDPDGSLYYDQIRTTLTPMEYNIFISPQNEKGCTTNITTLLQTDLTLPYGIYSLSNYGICLQGCANAIASIITNNGCKYIFI